MFKILLVSAGLAVTVFACLVAGSNDDNQHGRD